MIIVKPYTFIPKIIVDASEVNTNFDLLFSTLNGAVDSANMNSAFSFSANKVPISDPCGVFVATEVSGALNELHSKTTVLDFARGYNGIHTMPYGKKVKLFPGVVEINESKSYLNSANIIDPLDNNSALAGGAKYYVLFNGGSGNTITATDISFVNYDDETFAYSFSKAGIYIGSKRAIGAFYCPYATNTLKLEDAYFEDTISTMFLKSLTSSETEYFGFGCQAVSIGVSDGVAGQCRVYDFKRKYYSHVGSYGFDSIIKAGSQALVYSLVTMEPRSSNHTIDTSLYVEYQATGGLLSTDKTYIVNNSTCGATLLYRGNGTNYINIYVSTALVGAGIDQWMKLAVVPRSPDGGKTF